MEDLIISLLERHLQAKYLNDLTPGHTGARLVKFQQKDKIIVAKFPLSLEVENVAAIEENIRGYEKILCADGELLIPSGYQTLTVNGMKVLLMDFLGDNLRTGVAHDGKEVYTWMKNHLRIIYQNALRPASQDLYTQGINDIRQFMMKFGRGIAALTDDILDTYLQCPWQLKGKYVTLMLLDFTPDNIFVTRERLSFIDPWSQVTYLGNPAVSLGQFITLARDIYALPFAEEGCSILQQFAFEEIPALLECPRESVELAFNLGMALQYILSAFVRVHTATERAQEYARYVLATLKKMA